MFYELNFIHSLQTQIILDSYMIRWIRAIDTAPCHCVKRTHKRVNAGNVCYVIDIWVLFSMNTNNISRDLKSWAEKKKHCFEFIILHILLYL